MWQIQPKTKTENAPLLLNIGWKVKPGQLVVPPYGYLRDYAADNKVYFFVAATAAEKYKSITTSW